MVYFPEKWFLGWSESYYADMKKEAQQELRKQSLPLLEALTDFRDALETYRDFAEYADELEVLLDRLERFLADYRST